MSRWRAAGTACYLPGPPGDLPHVFERFYRAGDARGKPGGGALMRIRFSP